MDLKEEIDKRLKTGFTKKEIVNFLLEKGYEEKAIKNSFPILERTNPLYLFILIFSSLISGTLLVLGLIFSNLLSLAGLITLTLCLGTFLIFKMTKIGFVIHIIFYALIILIWLAGLIYYEGNGPDMIDFSLWSFVIVLSFCSFMIRSLYMLYKKC